MIWIFFPFDFKNKLKCLQNASRNIFGYLKIIFSLHFSIYRHTRYGYEKGEELKTQSREIQREAF